MTVVPFKRPDPPARPTSHASKASGSDNMLSVLVECMAEAGMKSTMLDTITIRKHLNSLIGVVSQSNIQQRKEGLADYSDDQLREMVRNSSPLDWSTRPAFYWALIGIVGDRKLT